MTQKIAVIIGAGPAGLTAAYELLHRAEVRPVLYETAPVVGGICRTVNYKGNRMDIGGHRFFSKSDRVLEWWENILPLQGAPVSGALDTEIAYEGQKRPIRLKEAGPDPERTDRVMLLRSRRSRIFFLRKFFDYPLSLSLKVLSALGWGRSFRIAWSYLQSRLCPVRPEASLRDFLINRFGRELYFTFFKSYTEKVWGVPCHRIKAEWGAQRIKGLNLRKAIINQARSIVSKDPTYIERNVETSLIQKFMYPKYGPGQMWEEVTRVVAEKGAEIQKNCKVVGVKTREGVVEAVEVKNLVTGELHIQALDYLFSSMPVKELIECFGSAAPPAVTRVAEGLLYRDFITVGVLLRKLRVREEDKRLSADHTPRDNWIYIQERDVKVGRIQIFNNWSPYLVKDRETVWIGMEYFCNEGDELWSKPDETFMDFAVEELVKIGFAEKEDILDRTLIRMLKTYPAYFGSYDHFDTIRKFTDRFENLFLIGRNGMHKYNNQDHSMLTAMVAVDNIVQEIKTKDNIWAVNTELSYQEEK
jgi:protoporphyrinogen oxidase